MIALAYIGVLIFILGAIGTIIASFKVGVLWGIGCLLLAPVSLIFLILHWDVAKNPFLLQISGLVLVFIGGGFQ
jgi:hypothetical protein